ncbi:hypothetical protein COHCIP112018_03369 [Cohnella sp. JJ-181]|nr:hypothetical protein COHCIP112018_03369 [Cohnella sp. JJ-181]
MRFSIQYLSFFVIQSESPKETDTNKRYKHYKTLDHYDYEDSEIKSFLDEEFTRIGKRKADVNPDTSAAPTKIGRFIIEPGQEPESNPNYNLFQRLRVATTKEQFHYACDDILRSYMDTSAVRGGAFIVAAAKINELFDEPFVFVLKCDFESKIARISDERSLISKVDMAISARNIKSIQYPHMPEEGMLEPNELKIHQASHARYFEDFLKYVSYEKSKPEIVNDQVMGLVQEYMERKWSGDGADGESGYAADGGAGALAGLAAGPDAGLPADYGAGPDAAGGYGAYEAIRERDPSAADMGYGAAGYDDAGQGSGGYGGGGHGGGFGGGGQQGGGQGGGGVSRAARGSGGWAQEAREFEMWAAGDKRQLQEKWTHEDVMGATAHIVEYQPDLELKFKADDISVRAKMSDYGDAIHIARMNGKYVLLIEADGLQFEKGMSPIELLHPEDIEQVLARMRGRPRAGH